jgi:hypothetical protein
LKYEFCKTGMYSFSFSFSTVSISQSCV